MTLTENSSAVANDTLERQTSMCEDPADGEAFCLLLPSPISILSGDTLQPENTYSCVLKVMVRSAKVKKRIRINANHSNHKCSSPLVLANLTKKSDSVLTNLIEKDGVQSWSK